MRLIVIGSSPAWPNAGGAHSGYVVETEGRRLLLRVAVDYSARDTIVRAAGSARPGEVLDRDGFASLMSAALHEETVVPDVDLLVRTGGERRLSDFLLWECAYAELYFTDLMWPDFGSDALSAALADFRRHRIGFVFQDHHLLPQCNVLENVLVPFLADGAATEDDLSRATDLLTRVGLAERLMHRPAELSGGERQRVAIARALVRHPTLLLADEPTGNLDRTTARSITELLIQLQIERQAILIIVTHSAALAEALQRRLEIDSGRLVSIA